MTVGITDRSAAITATTAATTTIVATDTARTIVAATVTDDTGATFAERHSVRRALSFNTNHLA